MQVAINTCRFEIANIFCFIRRRPSRQSSRDAFSLVLPLLRFFLPLSSSFFSCSLRLFAAAKNAAPGASFSSSYRRCCCCCRRRCRCLNRTTRRRLRRLLRFPSSWPSLPLFAALGRW